MQRRFSSFFKCTTHRRRYRRVSWREIQSNWVITTSVWECRAIMVSWVKLAVSRCNSSFPLTAIIAAMLTTSTWKIYCWTLLWPRWVETMEKVFTAKNDRNVPKLPARIYIFSLTFMKKSFSSQITFLRVWKIGLPVLPHRMNGCGVYHRVAAHVTSLRPSHSVSIPLNVLRGSISSSRVTKNLVTLNIPIVSFWTMAIGFTCTDISS